MNVARSPPNTTYTAIPIGRRKQAAMMFIPVSALTVAAPPTARMILSDTIEWGYVSDLRRRDPHTTRMQRKA